MGDETSDLFADIPTDGDTAVEPEESQPSKTEEDPKDSKEKEETPSQAEPKPQEDADKPVEKPASVENLPFHKHPRWIRQQEKEKELAKQIEELKQKLEQSAVPKITSQEEQKFVPPNLQNIFGNDVETYQTFQKFSESQIKQIFEAEMSRREQEQKARQTQEETEKEKARLVYEERLTELGEEIGLPLHDTSNNERNQILDICVEYGIVDAQGYPDFKKANALREKLYPPKVVSEERKRVASNASKASLSDAPIADEEVMTPSKLKNKRIDQFFR